MNEIKELLNKCLSLVSHTQDNAYVSNIDKDMLLSNMRKMYDITLAIKTGEIHENKSVQNNEVVQVQTAISTSPSSNISIEQPARESTKVEQIVIPVEIPKTEQTASESIKVEQIVVPVEIPKVENLPVVEIKEEVVPKVETIEVVEAIPEPIPVPNKPSFDDLVNKVKEQFDNKPKPQTLQSVTEDEDDDGVPVFFSDFEFDKLFDSDYARELSEKLSNGKLENIEKAMGLNEKIFTVNELFDGDSSAFETAIHDLQGMNNFETARLYITERLASKYEWMNPGKFKKAREFVKLVKRKFA